MVGIISVLCQLLDKLIRTLENAVHFCKDIYQHIKHLWLTKNKIQKRKVLSKPQIIKKREVPPRQRRPPKMYGYDEYV